MPLNELGDFLAGAFGPLAIAWLILGFFQQGKELQQSTEALQLQAKELNNSVQQQERMAKVTSEALAFEKENVQYERGRNLESIKPSFTILDAVATEFRSGAGLISFKVNLVNVGGDALKVVISSSIESEILPSSLGVWGGKSAKPIELKLNSGFPKGGMNLTVSFLDAEGREGEQEFIVNFLDNGENTLPTLDVRLK